jgi:hypothetical protein
MKRLALFASFAGVLTCAGAVAQQLLYQAKIGSPSHRTTANGCF